MSQSLRYLLLCSVALSVYPACGLEVDSETQFNESSLNGASIYEPESLDPSRERTPTRFIVGAGAMQPSEQILDSRTHGAIVIDRSGSMMTPRSINGMTSTRCKDALVDARSQAHNLLSTGVQAVGIIIFPDSNGNTQLLAPGYVSTDAAVDLILDGLSGDGCAGLTPLGDAMCFAARNLNENSSSGQDAQLILFTDGGENNSDRNNCGGDPGDFETPNSWAAKVKLVLTHVSDTSGDAINYDFDHYTDNLLTIAQSGGPGVAALCSDPVSCDRKLFAALANETGGEYRQVRDNNPAYPCSSPSLCPAPDSNNVGNHFSFTAVNTNSATVRTVNHSVFLQAGETISMGTCGVPGSAGVGDTYLRVFDPAGQLVAINDDNCGGLLSFLAFTAPVNGTYLVRAGCFSINNCSGTVAYMIQGSFTYSASLTNSATVNTVNRNVYLRPGQRTRVGTCGLPLAAGTGDTFLRLRNTAGVEVTLNDDSCGGLLSNFLYSVPAGSAGMHQLRAGCFSTGSCSGRVAYLTDEPPPPVIITGQSASDGAK